MSSGGHLEKKGIEQPVAVAVEGRDYYYTLLSQIRDDPQLQEVQLWDFKGENGGNLARWLRLFRTLPGFAGIRAIGIIRDAEDDAGSMVQSIASALQNNGFDAPTSPLSISSSKPAVGFLLMPHSRESGCFEHAMLAAAASHLPLQCAQDFLKCVDDSKRNDNWRAKVQVHALIAAGKNPAWTIAESARAGLWDFGHPSLSVIKDFLKRLSGT